MTARNPTSPMNITEIKRALRRAAEVCVERRTSDWERLAVLPQDEAFLAAFAHGYPLAALAVKETPADAAMYLLIVAEAI